MPRAFRRSALALSALASLATPALARAKAIDAFYERAVMTAADQRCRLFTPELASALQAAEAQARGAALRSGYSGSQIAEVEERAEAKIASVPCNSPDIALAATRVRAAFDGYSRLVRANYPGDIADWTADRSTSRRAPIWKLSQTTQFPGGVLVFGLAGEDGPSALIAVAVFRGGAEPYAARLVMRDASLAPVAFINELKSTNGRTPLSARTPPRSATDAVMAEARAAPDPALLPPGARGGAAFRFPKSAVQALNGLDPREAVAIDFLFASRDGPDEVRTAYIEVGDFAAGRAFLAADQR